MKKRTLAGIAALLTCTGLFVGCGGNQSGPINEAKTETETEVEVVENEVEETETVVEEAPAEEAEEETPELHTVNISDWSYDSLSYISKDYLMAKNGDIYYIIDHEGNILPDDKLTYITNGFDRWNLCQQDGAFIVGQTNEDGTYNYCVFKPDLECIHSAENSSYYVKSFRDNIIIRENDEEISLGAYADTESMSTLSFSGSEYSSIGTSYGYMIFNGKIFFTDGNAISYCASTDDVFNYLIEKTDPPHSLELSVDSEYGDTVEFNNNLPNEQGWISANIGTWTVNADNTLSFEGKVGFYNLKTGAFVPGPKDAYSCSFFTERNGCGTCTVISDRSLQNIGTDADGNNLYRIFDLNTGEYASEDTYLYAQIGYSKLLLVQTSDGKWGYIKDEDLTPAGDRYDDATEFCNGYAIVTNAGKSHLIDEDLNTVSEEFDALGASAVTDYYTFSDLNGKSVFFVKDSEDKVHLATIE